MNYKIFPLSIAFCTAITLPLISCSDSEIHASDVPELTQSIFVVPEGYYGDPYNDMRYASSDKFYVNINEKIRICGIYAINGEYVSTDKAIPYYITHKWNIDNNEASASSIYYSFDKAGAHEVTFETIDHLGDTLQTKATIYVNTPTTITLQSPANNYNQADGDNEDGIELSWGISGIDPWENSYCTLYASYNEKKIWDSPLGNVECTNSVNLIGELNADVTEKGDTINHSIETSTIYWGIRATIKNETGLFEQTYSDVFNFSTKLKNDGAAIVEIPVVSQFNPFPEKSKLTGAILSAAGDTLSKIAEDKSTTNIQKTLSPQSNIKIVICDAIRTEYGCDSMTINLAPNTKTITDTLYLRDKVKPNLTPVYTDLPTTASIKFVILDNGSGVNGTKVLATINADTVQTKYESNVVSITNTCHKECTLVINAEDYARNKVPNVYWKIKVNGSETKISGPFAKPEDDK
ncbi:hypothetical protein [Fibrobacter sp. UWB11]|uniref:hypothetical protein n=1 Tax=Fibrobacter sp. UWB11 TaxID=1896202 RepID=UPI0009285B7E|nr:hypothetical protein [Fibrobacter sp. UWB11]SIN86911.1 hypothetical protein SAMN05720758_0327 [Fibrobacter sp. UWB11]